MWLSAVLAAFLFSILVVQPLKVIIFALIHALLLKVVYFSHYRHVNVLIHSDVFDKLIEIFIFFQNFWCC
jgi:hypothetical protein